MYVGAGEGAVDELIDQHKGSWRQLLFERAAGRERDEVGDPCPLHHVDIGAVVDVARRESVTLVVTRQEYDGKPIDVADPKRRRRLAPRAVDAPLAYVLQARQVVDA